MALPIVSRPTEFVSIDRDASGSFYYLRAGSRQKKPYTLPSPFLLETKRTIFARGTGPGFSGSYGGNANANTFKSYPLAYIYGQTFDWSDSVYPSLMNKAKAKFKDKISANAEWLVNLAERKQSMEMIENRLLQLWEFARKLRRGDVVGAAWQLGLAQPREAARRVDKSLARRNKAKTFANRWLEFHFGWEPLASDIDSACKFLSEPINDCPIATRVTASYLDDKSMIVTETWQGFDRLKWVRAGKRRVRIGGSVRIDNPNLFLANRMGMVNPATIAWELVPFSFVVDWFVNVGEFLASFTEFWGMTIVDPYHTYYGTETVFGTRQVYTYNPLVLQTMWEVSSTSSKHQRLLGIPNTTLGVRPPWRLSPTRALTAASLLIQQGLK